LKRPRYCWTVWTGNHVANNRAYRYRPRTADWMAEQLGAAYIMWQRRSPLRRGVFFAVSLLLASCTSGPKYEDVAASIPPIPVYHARIVIFRDSAFGTGRENMRVTIDGATVGYVPLGSVLTIDHSPGVLHIHVETSGIFRGGEVDMKLSARPSFLLSEAIRH
jgi:hypothetical protein